jgi:AraC family transcriptional regulator
MIFIGRIVILENSSIPLPMEAFLPEMILYESKEMYICMPKTDTNFLQGIHCHEGYEFFIPFTDMPFVLIDDKCYYAYKNHILPVNPEQWHGVSRPMNNIKFIDILISKSFMQETAEKIYNSKNVEFINGVYPINRSILNIIEMYLEEGKMNAPGISIMLESLSHNIAVLILRDIKNNLVSSREINSNNYTCRVKDVIDYIHTNYNSDCSLKELSEIADMSSFHLIRTFKLSTGKTPIEYLLDVRIDKAKSLLTNKSLNILDICIECGFNNVSHFIRIFKKRVGYTPSEYRIRVLK